MTKTAKQIIAVSIIAMIVIYVSFTILTSSQALSMNILIVPVGILLAGIVIGSQLLITIKHLKEKKLIK